jgi:hypothetical protein
MASDILERLRKIAALAARGVGGEARNAEKLLADAARRYHIDLAQLDGAERRPHLFYHGPEAWRRTLMCQLIMKRDRKAEIFKLFEAGKRVKISTALRIICTDEVFVEAAAAFPVLAEGYMRQRRALLRAVLQANDLLLPPDEGAERRLTEAELEMARDASRLSIGIDRTQIHKQLAEAK